MKDPERLAKPAHPLPIYPRFKEVKVYMGAGWEKGSVMDSSRNHCTVRLGRRNATTTCRDARNIHPA